MNANLSAGLKAALLLAAALAGAARANDVPVPQAAASQAARPGVATFTLKLPMDQPVVFRGMVSLDDAGVQSGQMMYPAPNAGGLLVAIFAHGLVVESQKNSQRSQLQQAADKVLEAHKDTLGGFLHADLVQRGTAQAGLIGDRRHVGAVGADEGEWIVESVPVFTLGQDQTVLVLEHAVAIRDRGEPQKLLHQAVVKVVSSAKDVAAPADYWAADQGRRLKEESALLFAHSLGLVLDQAARPAPEREAPQKTYRYAEGRKERMERGSLVGEHCNRIVIKTLRGWLMSIPARPAAAGEAAAPACTDPLLPA